MFICWHMLHVRTEVYKLIVRFFHVQESTSITHFTMNIRLVRLVLINSYIVDSSIHDIY